MHIILAGAQGKVGSYLQQAWRAQHEVLTLTRQDVDLRDGEALRRFFGEIEFDAVVNCAAMASPDACEEDPEGAELVNAVAPGLMAELCAQRGARLVHFSTDYVLEGTKPGLKDESAPTGGLGHYGHSKLAGERRILDADPTALICRASWVFGGCWPAFLDTIVARARSGDPLEAVGDKWSKPTNVAELARIVEQLLAQPLVGGVLHLTHPGEAESWWTYACKAVTMACEIGLLEQIPDVAKVKMIEIPQLAALRPAHTAMCSSRLADLLESPLRGWEEAAAEHLQALRARECH